MEEKRETGIKRNVRYPGVHSLNRQNEVFAEDDFIGITRFEFAQLGNCKPPRHAKHSEYTPRCIVLRVCSRFFSGVIGVPRYKTNFKYTSQTAV